VSQVPPAGSLRAVDVRRVAFLTIARNGDLKTSTD